MVIVPNLLSGLRIFLSVLCSFTFHDSGLKCSFFLSYPFLPRSREKLCVQFFDLCVSGSGQFYVKYDAYHCSYSCFFVYVYRQLSDVSGRCAITAVLFVVAWLVMCFSHFLRTYLMSISILFFLKMLLRYPTCFHLCSIAFAVFSKHLIMSYYVLSELWMCSVRIVILIRLIWSPLNIRRGLCQVSIPHELRRLRLGQESSTELRLISIITDFWLWQSIDT
jgi:hypothetical protein